MAKVSSKTNKTAYQLRREELGLSREKASELLGSIAPERLERIESGKFTAHPDEILLMAKKYKAPALCNQYCANDCDIGREYVPQVEVKHLSQIVLSMLATLNTVQSKRDRLIEITADGRINDNEIEAFIDIQESLEKISITVEALQLWTEKKLASGEINLDLYEELKSKR